MNFTLFWNDLDDDAAHDANAQRVHTLSEVAAWLRKRGLDHAADDIAKEETDAHA